jgi:DNA-binding ferritin-like protein
MEKINTLIFSLVALQNYCKDIHYHTKGDAFYSKHLLADRVEENISDYVDRIKEVYFLGSEEKLLPSSEYLTKAAKLIPELKEDDKEKFKDLRKLIIDTLKTLNSIKSSTKGEENLYGAIAEDLQNSLGLINRQIS